MLFVKVIVLFHCRLQLHRLREIFRELVSRLYHDLIVVNSTVFEMRDSVVSMLKVKR
jgi:hypothetical protein